MILKVIGDSKTVIGKTDNFASEDVKNEISQFDNEIIEIFGWKKAENIVIK